MHGFLNIDKPAGMTSHDVVARIRRVAQQRRVGHAGTLDPAATGVLVVALGAATRLIQYVQDDTVKSYRAVVHLGVRTETDDAEGARVEIRPVPQLERIDLELVLEQFRGSISQVPPMYSALHHQGRRLYELAREGVVVDVAPRTIIIEQLTLVDWMPPFMTLDVQCHKGTYIRALARDIGIALECGAHLHALRRTAVGPFRIDQATALTALETDAQLAQALLPPDTAVLDWPAIQLSASEAQRVCNGLALALASEIIGNNTRAYTPDGVLLALLGRDGDSWRPVKVFDWSKS